MDIKSSEERGRNMATIHSKNTKPQYLFTGVSGIGIRDVNMLICQNPEWNSGRKNLRLMLSESGSLF